MRLSLRPQERLDPGSIRTLCTYVLSFFLYPLSGLLFGSQLHSSFSASGAVIDMCCFQPYVLSFKETIWAELAPHSQHQFGSSGHMSTPGPAGYGQRTWSCGKNMAVRSSLLS